MSDEDIRLLASEQLYELYRSNKLYTPISSSGLWAFIVASSNSSPAQFSLLDLRKFETALLSLASGWDYGRIHLARDDFGLTLLEVALGEPASANVRPARVIDEEADSAAGDDDMRGDDEADEEEALLDSLWPMPRSLRKSGRAAQEAYTVLLRATARTRLLAEQFRSLRKFEPICAQITKDECSKFRQSFEGANNASICDMIHFRPLIRPHTDPSLGYCSYLNTCYSEPTYAHSPSLAPFHSTNARQGSGNLPSGLGAGGQGKSKAPCRYLHFEVDWDETDRTEHPPSDPSRLMRPVDYGIGKGPGGTNTKLLPPQWINCDVRKFDYSTLGKFHVIMLDPPWDIHMNLPYGTMTDDEMKAMPIPTLQDEGLIFLWVTGRAMEVGRECLRVWGYTRVDEIIWLKTNQLQRVIRTGRTGHWLNHTKEHMLVGVKTRRDSNGHLIFPSWVNRGLDTDVIVSEVRETSRKPDEAYSLIERMCPGGRKVEIFGRKHNTQPGWLTLGNQLGEDRLYEQDMVKKINVAYPERKVTLSFVE